MRTGKYLLAIFTLAIILTSCKQDPFENKLYISSGKLVSDLLFNADHSTASRTISVRLAQPMDRDVEVTFEARADMTAEYNMIYGDNARMLPEKHYQISSLKSLVSKGSVLGEDIEVRFSGLEELNKDFRYVLPVHIVDSGAASVLETARTTYFLFKGAALVNVVADISKLKIPIKWSDTALPMLTATNALTVECIMRSSNWTMSGNAMGLGSIFGREGLFLIRVGDSGYGPNQPQIVGSGGGNWPSATASPKFPTNQWVHFAFVLDCQNKRRTIYINGVEITSDSSSSIVSSLTFPKWQSWNSSANSMSIGFAWDDQRYLPCEVAEYRVWNVARTQRDIESNMLSLDPAVDGSGLVAYWKFNDGTGNKIKDHSGNGTDLTTEASTWDGNTKFAPLWNQVELYSTEDF